MQVNETLAERDSVYGTFLDNATIADALIAIMQDGTEIYGGGIALQDVTTHWRCLAPDQRLALQHIAAKIGRILTGHTDHIDNWHDIAGYATLIADRLTGKTHYVTDAAASSPEPTAFGGEKSNVDVDLGNAGAPFPPIEAAGSR